MEILWAEHTVHCLRYYKYNLPAVVIGGTPTQWHPLGWIDRCANVAASPPRTSESLLMLVWVSALKLTSVLCIGQGRGAGPVSLAELTK
eukprot:5886566-Amphidinium_carterae.1